MPRRPVAGDQVGAEGAQGVLGVVAGLDGLGDGGGAAGLKPGEEDGGFDLGGGDRRVEVDGAQGTAVDGHGGVAVGEGDAGAHLLEGLADALHGAGGERVVAGEAELAGLRGDEAGEHAHRGAGVAAVQRLRGLSEVAGGAGDGGGAGFRVGRDLRAEGGHAGQRAVRVGAGGEVRKGGGAFGKAGEQGVAVRNGLVAGQHERAAHGAGGANQLGGAGGGRGGKHGCSLAA